jgi:hypothetical protein
LLGANQSLEVSVDQTRRVPVHVKEGQTPPLGWLFVRRSSMEQPFWEVYPNLYENIQDEARLIAHQKAKLHGEFYEVVFDRVFKVEFQRLLEEAGVE